MESDDNHSVLLDFIPIEADGKKLIRLFKERLKDWDASAHAYFNRDIRMPNDEL